MIMGSFKKRIFRWVTQECYDPYLDDNTINPLQYDTLLHDNIIIMRNENMTIKFYEQSDVAPFELRFPKPFIL